ncbi:MAG: putative RNA uridine N3 methyltransferase [Desulfurococcaceae archaeon]
MDFFQGTVLVVVLPTSILSVEHGLALKSIRIHQVARWASIFGVKEVVFYKEASTNLEEFEEHERLLRDHWSYFFTPPYLRKQLVPLTPTLKYVGILPPIRLDVFNVSRKPRQGEVRLGYVFEDDQGKMRSHVGDTAIYTVINKCSKTGLIPVRVIDVNKHLVECIDGNSIYKGPNLRFARSLKEIVIELAKNVDYLIATDRRGVLPEEKDIVKMRGKSIAVLFGSPRFDLFEISSQEGFDLVKYVDYIWNTIPRQRVVTIRTEEALIITLGIINAFLRGG